jgi:hypothetical protein
MAGDEGGVGAKIRRQQLKPGRLPIYFFYVLPPVRSNYLRTSSPSPGKDRSFFRLLVVPSTFFNDLD